MLAAGFLLLTGSFAWSAPVVTEILGRPTDRSVTVNVRADAAVETYFEYGGKSGAYLRRDTGKYVNPPAAGYREERYHRDTHKMPRLISRQIVWSYRSRSNMGFFSHIGSSGQRLPNGNTLICSDTEGHLFEVTSDGELAWEYINPVTREGALKTMPDTLPMTNSVFRALRYTADHPALRGRDLNPRIPITDMPARPRPRRAERPKPERRNVR